MTELDHALEKYIQDDTQQAQYYDLVLNTDFYIPITEDETDSPLAEKKEVTPLILESDGKSYLMLFDSENGLPTGQRNRPTMFCWPDSRSPNSLLRTGTGR